MKVDSAGMTINNGEQRRETIKWQVVRKEDPHLLSAIDDVVEDSLDVASDLLRNMSSRFKQNDVQDFEGIISPDFWAKQGNKEC